MNEGYETYFWEDERGQHTVVECKICNTKLLEMHYSAKEEITVDECEHFHVKIDYTIVPKE